MGDVRAIYTPTADLRLVSSKASARLLKLAEHALSFNQNTTITVWAEHIAELQAALATLRATERRIKKVKIVKIDYK